MGFTKAVKSRSRLRIALTAPSGGGKSYTMLQMATRLLERMKDAGEDVGNGRIAAIDTEAGSLSLYADVFDFDVIELEAPFTPARYRELFGMAQEAGYPVLCADSLSHAWTGKGGALEMVDNAAKRTNNKFSAWGDVTPEHHALVEEILRFPGHVLTTMRSKVDYAQQQDGGRTRIVKLGMAPVQRDGMEYEFTFVGDIDLDHVMSVSKTRCSALDGGYFNLLEGEGNTVADTLYDWLMSGASSKDIFLGMADDVGATEEEIAALGERHPDLKGHEGEWGTPQYDAALRFLRQYGKAGLTKNLLKHAEEQMQPDPEPTPEPTTATTGDAGEGEAKKNKRRHYFALVRELELWDPLEDGADVARQEWQEAVVGKASTKDWDVEDYDVAIGALERRKAAA